MSQPWLADECRHQAFLFLAADLLPAARRPTGTASGCPAPLLVKDSGLAAAVARGLTAIPRGSTTAIEDWVNDAFREHGAKAGSGIPATPWSRADLVRWWLHAGRALATFDGQQFQAFKRLTRGPGGLLHPAIWCAERFERFSLSPAGFDRECRNDDWNGVIGLPGECRKRLFMWVMSPERVRPGLGENANLLTWFSHLRREMETIHDDAVELFGDSLRLQLGGEVSLQTIDHWVARWTNAPLGERVLNELRRPVIYPTAAGTRHLVKGVVFLQFAPNLLADLETASAKSAEQSGNLPALARATAFAAARWRPGEAVAKLWTKPAKTAADTRTFDLVERCLLAVARWLTAAKLVTEIDPPPAARDPRREFIEAIRIALAIEGFRVDESRGGPAAARAIPVASGAPGGYPALSLSREAAGFHASIGCLDAPASCGQRLFAAIEAVDWRLWAFSAAPWDLAEDITRRIVEFLQQLVLRSDEWETIKRQSLHTTGGREDEETLATLFNYANHRHLALELFRAEVYGGHAADVMLAGLIGEFRDVAKEALAALAAIAPAALRRLEPPRREDGTIDVPVWLARGGPSGSDAEAAIPYRLCWHRSIRPSGELLEERRAGAVVEVSISAGDVGDTELALLNAQPLSGRSGQPGGDEFGAGLVERIAAFKARLVFPETGAGPPAAGGALIELRASFAGEAAPAFHELIARCRAGQQAAVEWCRIIQRDPDFRFACHPEIELETGVVRPPSLEDSFLAWDFDTAVSLGQDLAVRFAMTPAAARRMLSLGPRQPGSLADCTEHLAEACQLAGGPLAGLGLAVRDATYRWLTFGVRAPHPVTVIQPVLDELLLGEAATPARRTAVFQAASAWCESLDHSLLPSGWRADGRLLPAAFADLSLSPEFDEQAATGTVAVRRFGLQGIHGWPFSGAVSAGPAPAGFHDFRTAVELVGNALEAGHNPPVGDLVRRTEELARHSLAGTLSLALPNLFDRVWEMIVAESEPAVRPHLETAAARLFEMLKVACRMIPFEPAKSGEYPVGWMREADGTQPRGRRIKRIVRPGLRTVENVLVRPALVITE